MFRDSFISFLESGGIEFEERDGLVFVFPGRKLRINLVPLGAKALEGDYLHIFEDRWNSSGECLRKRILAHLGVFRSIFARNCTVSRIDAPLADSFLDKYHSYGRSQSRYRYGLFLKGELVAVSTFSGKRTMNRESGPVDSYEWIRCACLPEARISGGMGKMLSAFINDVHPSEVMSYADLEWSDGAAYRALGFREAGRRAPVSFYVDTVSWVRTPAARIAEPAQTQVMITNLGSVKYLLSDILLTLRKEYNI